MRGKKRVEMAMNLEKPDRVPFDGLLPHKSPILYLPMLPPKSWKPEDKKGVYPNVEPLMLKFRLWKWNPQNWEPPKEWWKMPRLATDPFGCVWEYAENDATKGHPGNVQPMKSLDRAGDWPLPDPYDKSMYKLPKFAGKLLFWKYKVGLLDSLLYARVQYLRGFNNSLMDLARGAEGIKKLIRRLTDYFKGAIEMWAKAGVDAVYGQDDMGAQNELFMSPRMYKKYFAKPYKELAETAHDNGLKFILHSCGHVNKLIPIWIDCGIDALQFDSPKMTGLEYDQQFCGKIGFHLVPDIQKVYPFANVEDFEGEIKRMIKTMGKKGGLIIRDYLGATKVLEVPERNQKALPKLVKKYGKYPL